MKREAIVRIEAALDEGAMPLEREVRDLLQSLEKAEAVIRVAEEVSDWWAGIAVPFADEERLKAALAAALTEWEQES